MIHRFSKLDRMGGGTQGAARASLGRGDKKTVRLFGDTRF